jgi:uncharacterized repeat protein (TIGR01451 family)
LVAAAIDGILHAAFPPFPPSSTCVLEGVMPRSRRHACGEALLVLVALLSGVRPLLGQEEPAVRLVSKGGSSSPAIGGSNAAVSADGRYVAFSSSSGAGVVGLVDTNDAPDVFLFDRVTGQTVLVSRSTESPLKTANRESGSAVISADGRYVAFVSFAYDLVGGVTVGTQLYLYSRVDQSVTLVSHLPGMPSQGVFYQAFLPAISADGAYVAFVSYGTELVGGSASFVPQVFLFERSTGIVRLVSHTVHSETIPGGTRLDFAPAISADGSLVAFLSNRNLVSLSAEVVVTQVFLYRREDRGITLVSHAFDGATSLGDWPSTPPALSADGRFVAFSSASTNLVEGFVVGGLINQNIFLYSVADGSIDLISPAAGTTVVGGNGYSGSIVPPAISADGGLVAFQSRGTNLVPGFQGPDPPELNVFLYSRGDASVKLVSHSPGSPLTAGDADSYVPVIASDGSALAFQSWATDLVPGPDANEALDLFVVDATTGVVSLASHAVSEPGHALGAEGSSFVPLYGISADGRWIAYQSPAVGLVAEADLDGITDAFLFDRVTDASGLVSRRATSGPFATGLGRSSLTALNGGPVGGSPVSADGRFVVLTSDAHDLVPGQPDTDPANVFIHDRSTSETRPLSKPGGPAAQTGYAGRDPTITPDGRYVAFAVRSCLYLWSRDTDSVEILFDASTSTPCRDDFVYVYGPVLSADGRTAAFVSNRIGGYQLYVWTRDGGVRLASHAAGNPGSPAHGSSGDPRVLSDDGCFVVFGSEATDLVSPTGSGDVNAGPDVFLYSLETDSTVLVSHALGGPSVAANQRSLLAGASADAGVVVFASRATNLTGIVGLPQDQIYLYRRLTGEVTLVSHAAGLPNQPANGPVLPPGAAVNASGSHIAFQSFASDLVPGQSPEVGMSVYLYSTADDATRLVSHVPGQPGRSTSGGSFVEQPRALSADGRHVLFTSFAPDILAAPASPSGVGQLYLWSADSDESILVSRSTSGSTAGADAQHHVGALSADGRWVAFDSPASNLVPGDLNGQSDVFLFGPTRPGADLAVGVAAPTQVTPPATVTATFVVVNLGPEEAAGVVLSLTSPPGFGAPTSSGACSAWPCSIGMLTAGQFVTVTVAFAVPSSYVAPDPALVRVSATASTPDPSPTNDVAQASVAIAPRADLELTMAGRATATPPDQLTYTLTLTNRGPSDAISVQLDDPTPVGLTLMSSDGACPSAFPCAIGALGPGDSRTATATFTLPETYSGPDPIHNAAAATTATVDPNPNNNSPTLDTVVDAATPALGYFTLPPCRLVDTRLPDGSRGGPALAGGVQRWFTATGACGIPSGARAIAVNATVTGSDGSGNLRLWAAGKPVPTSSVVSFGTAQTRGASAIVGLDAFGALAARAAGPAHVHLILDVAGYFE